jgi:deoxyadenosine/deoxycytidine kinase
MSLFTIEANIGAGKSTLLAELQNLKFDKPHIVIQEQVKEWSNLKDNEGNDILSLFYKDKQKYSYIFQSYVLFSRLSILIALFKSFLVLHSISTYNGIPGIESNATSHLFVSYFPKGNIHISLIVS